jgi:hypothetical protein
MSFLSLKKYERKRSVNSQEQRRGGYQLSSRKIRERPSAVGEIIKWRARNLRAGTGGVNSPRMFSA